MSDFQDIQNLIRLKRHEQPPQDFVDDFVRSFQQRQRSEMLNQSARGLLWERVTTYFDGLLSPKMGWAAATAVAIAGAFFMMQPASNESGEDFVVKNVSTGGAAMEPISADEVKQYLLSSHYKGGFGDERENDSVVQSHQFENLPKAQGKVLPTAGFKLDIQQ
jgi:hypothetical protein